MIKAIDLSDSYTETNTVGWLDTAVADLDFFSTRSKLSSESRFAAPKTKHENSLVTV